MILSGGLTPANVGDAIAAVRPYAVDVASGVEIAPGRKDHEKLRAFSAAVAAGAMTSTHPARVSRMTHAADLPARPDAERRRSA
jgi:phosphoribosylanthranilate isomerase